ncbi:hypothetical protein H5410_051437, partial [Solanum commersonii]
KVEYHNGIPRVSWTEDEVNRMKVIELVQFAIVRNFSNVWLELEDLRNVIPRQCDIKGECKIGLLHGYSYPMRPLIYDAKFRVDEETTQVMASYLLFDFPKFVEVEVQGHEEEEYRVLHPNLRKNNNKEIIIIDAEQMQKGKQQSECIMENQRRREVRKTWNPTNRRFTKKANEVMNDKAVTPINGINSNNIFATLIDIDDGERDAQELDKDKKKLPVEQDKPPGSNEISTRESKQNEDINGYKGDIAHKQEENNIIISYDDIREGRFQDLTKRYIGRAIVNPSVTSEKSQPMEQLHVLISHQDLNEYAERKNSNNHDNLVEEKEEKESGSS